MNLIFFSSPFDNSSVDFLENLNVPAYKIASPEITDLNLIKYVASKNKPIIISTGIAEYKDIVNAVQVCHEVGNRKIGLLKCTSSYPAPVEEANLRTIPDLKEKFEAIIGLSDHTLGYEVAIASIALGSKIIEKHFILDKKIESPDSSFSLDKREFKTLVKSVRNAEKALGRANYELSDEIKIIRQNARSLFIVEDVSFGERFSEKNIRSIRPGQGLSPSYLNKILGKKAKKDYRKGTPVSKEMLS
jgi:pseudaminic acid synthase